MKIETVSNKNHVTFSELKVGDVFKFSGDSSFFLKVELNSSVKENGFVFNALDLPSSEFCYVIPHKQVVKVKAKLCIEIEE